jgi:hypothetical protein
VSDAGTLSYQWFKNTTNSTTGGTSIGSSATAASYVPQTNVAGTRYYYVVVTNTDDDITNGDKAVAVTSSVATVTIAARVNAATPVISEQPQDPTIVAGSSVTLSVTATVSDAGTLSYQWYVNTTNSTTGGTPIGSAASYELLTDAADEGSTKYYYVVVTNTATVNGTPTATVTSAVATVTVTVTATPPAPAEDETISIAAISGVTAPVYGATPVTVITATTQYTGTVSWSPAVSGTFAAGTAYTATITLTPKAGYTLTGVAPNFFKVAGATTVRNSANSGTVTAVFPATGTATGVAHLQANPLKVWMRGATLHVSGLTAGRTWSVYDIVGTLLYRGVASGDESENVTLSVRGVYVVTSGGKSVKVAY